MKRKEDEKKRRSRRASVMRTSTPRDGLCSMAMKVAILAVFSLTLTALRQQGAPAGAAERLADKQWRAVAPGKVEPASGEIRIMSTVTGRVADVLVNANDQVFTGELLIRLDEADARARLAKAQAQFAMQKRARNDEAVSGKAAQRRKAEDAVADSESAVFDAQNALDLAAATRRRDGAAQPGIDQARAKLARLQDQLKNQQIELRRVEAQAGMPLLMHVEGQFNVARAELSAAYAGVENTRIRAPSLGKVLQVNAKAGEIAGPTSTQPLVLFGDVSKLRVRAEVDEDDFADISVGESVVVRAAAFPDREFSGKVSFIAPIVERPRIRTGKTEDARVVETFAELSDAGPLPVGMKVDVYFMPKAQSEPTH